MEILEAREELEEAESEEEIERIRESNRGLSLFHFSPLSSVISDLGRYLSEGEMSSDETVLDLMVLYCRKSRRNDREPCKGFLDEGLGEGEGVVCRVEVLEECG